MLSKARAAQALIVGVQRCAIGHLAASALRAVKGGTGREWQVVGAKAETHVAPDSLALACLRAARLLQISPAHSTHCPTALRSSTWCRHHTPYLCAGAAAELVVGLACRAGAGVAGVGCTLVHSALQRGQRPMGWVTLNDKANVS